MNGLIIGSVVAAVGNEGNKGKVKQNQYKIDQNYKAITMSKPKVWYD